MRTKKEIMSEFITFRDYHSIRISDISELTITIEQCTGSRQICLQIRMNTGRVFDYGFQYNREATIIRDAIIKGETGTGEVLDILSGAMRIGTTENG